MTAPGGRLHVLHFDDKLDVAVPSPEEMEAARLRGVKSPWIISRKATVVASSSSTQSGTAST